MLNNYGCLQNRNILPLCKLILSKAVSPLRGPAPKMLYLTFSTMDRHKSKRLVTERAEKEQKIQEEMERQEWRMKQQMCRGKNSDSSNRERNKKKEEQEKWTKGREEKKREAAQLWETRPYIQRQTVLCVMKEVQENSRKLYVEETYFKCKNFLINCRKTNKQEHLQTADGTAQWRKENCYISQGLKATSKWSHEAIKRPFLSGL